MSEDGARAAAGTARARGAAVAVRRVPVVLALALAAGCRGGDWRVSQLYGGATSIDVITHPETVEAFRVSPDPPPADSEAPRVGDFAVTAGPVPVSADDAAELAAVLMDPDTYDWHRAKGCEFTPGVGVRLVKGASRVEIALCFSCDELMIFRRGRRIGMEDFDTARPRLVALARKWFPDDEQIRALR